MKFNSGDPWTNQDVSTFRFGSEGRSSYIQKMIVIELHGKHYVGSFCFVKRKYETHFVSACESINLTRLLLHERVELFRHMIVKITN